MASSSETEQRDPNGKPWPASYRPLVRGRSRPTRLGAIAIALAALLFSATLIGVELPHEFMPGTVIRAADVNANFQALATAKQEKLVPSTGIQIDKTSGISVRFGSALAGNSPDAGWSVVNTATSTGPNGCNGGGRGVYGRTSSGWCGAYSLAGVVGDADAPLNGVGMIAGSQSSDGGWGLIATYGGITGAPILAYNFGSGGVALRTYGGTIEVDSSSNPMAFVHRATPSNTAGDKTCIDSNLSNYNESALVTATHNLKASAGVRLPSAVAVDFDAKQSRWCIVAEDGSTLVNHAFNVMILKQM